MIIVDVPERELGYAGVRSPSVYKICVKYETMNENRWLKYVFVHPWGGNRSFLTGREILCSLSFKVYNFLCVN